MEQLNDEGMIHSDKDVAFSHHMILLLPLLNVFLLEDLHRIGAISLLTLLLDQHHLGIRALADHRKHVEVVQRELGLMWTVHFINNIEGLPITGINSDF